MEYIGIQVKRFVQNVASNIENTGLKAVRGKVSFSEFVQIAKMNIGEKNIMENKATIILDASKIDLFETCPCKYNYRYNLKKALPIINKNKSLDLGTLAHEGLAVYFKLLSEGIKYEERIKAAMFKISEIAADPMLSNSNPDEVDRLKNAVESSCDYWRAEDENCLEILGIEEPFAYVIYEDEMVRIIISGKIDLRVNYHGVGQQSSYNNLPLDHKTFSRDSTILRKSNQFINYCNVVDSMYLMVNRIGLHDPFAKNPKPPQEKFLRIPLSYDPIYIREWKENLTKMLLNEYLTCVATDTWPEKPTSCNKFNRLCEFYQVCDSSGKEAKAFKLESQYIDAPEWDVTAPLVHEGE